MPPNVNISKEIYKRQVYSYTIVQAQKKTMNLAEANTKQSKFARTNGLKIPLRMS